MSSIIYYLVLTYPFQYWICKYFAKVILTKNTLLILQMSNSGKKIHTRPHSTAVSRLAFAPMSLGRVWQGNRNTALIATGWDVPMNSAAKICTIRAERLLGKTSLNAAHPCRWLNRSSAAQRSHWTLVCGVRGWLQAGLGTGHSPRHPAGKGWHALEHFVPEDASGNILPRSHAVLLWPLGEHGVF